MPAVATHPFLEWPGPIPFAHRGGASAHPENTMPAFQFAVDLGYTYLETDVHATADGVLVAFHDAELDRVTDRTGAIAELPWSEVRQARVDGREPIPLFEELMEAFPDARMNIDCKADRAVEPLIASLRRLDCLDCLDRVLIGSFSDSRLRRLRQEFGDALATSFGPKQIVAWRLTGFVPWGGQVAQVPVSSGPVSLVTRRVIERAHRRGVQVHVWTIDDPAEMHRLLDLGVDGIMTDRPSVLKDVFVERGVWHE
ncbi:glycerophosphodiester phosphodiesterase [Ilumatobacter sp.]|uniref:glycerophosphodiester phosphodiesterase n=1 Tax=Ilumatobacter sp. TaxID=1967498 RepID=UPI003AF81371